MEPIFTPFLFCPSEVHTLLLLFMKIMQEDLICCCQNLKHHDIFLCSDGVGHSSEIWSYLLLLFSLTYLSIVHCLFRAL